MVAKTTCPACSETCNWEYFTGSYGIEEEKISCNCGFFRHFAYGEKEEYYPGEYVEKILSELEKYKNAGLTPKRCAELAKAEQEGRLVEWIEADLEMPDIGGRVLIYPIDGMVVTAEYYGEGEYVYNGRGILGHYIEQWAYTPKPKEG